MLTLARTRAAASRPLPSSSTRSSGARSAERDRAVERVGLVLAEEVVRRGVGHLDRAVGLTPSSTPNAGISSPAATRRDRELAPVMSPTCFGQHVGTPNSVSSDFGSSTPCASAGSPAVHDRRRSAGGQDTGQTGLADETRRSIKRFLQQREGGAAPPRMPRDSSGSPPRPGRKVRCVAPSGAGDGHALDEHRTERARPHRG